MITERERNPQRSRQRILASALTEFAAKGFAGARVEAIARKAGLNKQLISHHFGGKLGLYHAVMDRRRNRGGGEISVPPGPMPEALAELNELAGSDPEWIRVLLWETLERGEVRDLEPSPGEPVPTPDDRIARYRERVAWITDEQRAGRLPADLDPKLLLVSLMGAALYPLLLPNVADLICDEDTRTEDFADRYRDHLRKLGEHLAVSPAGRAKRPASPGRAAGSSR